MQKQTQTIEQRRGFSLQRHPATDAVFAATDLNGILGDPTRHLTGMDGVHRINAIGKNVKTNPNYVAKTYTFPPVSRTGFNANEMVPDDHFDQREPLLTECQ